MLENINKTVGFSSLKFKTRETYEIEYMENIFNSYCEKVKVNLSSFIYGKGKRKTYVQKGWF